MAMGLVIGIDEAGRGPLAGPVVAAAVVLPEKFHSKRKDLPRLTDSKQLTIAARQEWHRILTTETHYGIGIASVAEIASINILQATFLAMQRALKNLEISEELEIWVDGNQKPKFENVMPEHVKCFIGGDALHAPVSAASVIAKVTRDRMMQDLYERYPHYGWNSNMGYGSAAHRAAIIKHGPCPEHRALFLRKILGTGHETDQAAA